MSILWNVISVVITGFIYVLVLLPHGVGERNVKELHDAFVQLGLVRWLIAMALLLGYFFVANLGSKENEMVNNNEQSSLSYFAASAALFITVLMSVLLYSSIGIDNGERSVGGFITGFIGIFGLALFVLSVVFLSPIAVWCFFYVLPFFFVAIYTLFISSKSANIAEKHAKNKRPNDVIEAELAKAMISGLKSDFELQKIIHELSPISRFLHTLTYKKKAEKYREVRDLLDAQTEASRGRSGLGKKAHETERARRNGR